MKKQSKNLISLIALLAVFFIGYSTESFGAPAHNIKYTPHNLGSTHKQGAMLWGINLLGEKGQFYSNNETEICVFCHTPHNAAAGKQFLWNKTNAITTFQMYTGSSTLDFGINPAAPSEASKMCLACHDGAGAVNAMANPRSVTMLGGWSGDQLGDVYTDPFDTGDWKVNIGGAAISDPPGPGSASPDAWDPGTGGSLVNDHPISFVYSQSTADPTINAADGPGGSSIGGLPLWWSDNGNPGYKIECVTCHDPHINYVSGTPGGDSAYMPFLRKTMSSSSLCFTCHNK